MRWPKSPRRWRAARTGAFPLPMRNQASIQCSSQLSQRGKTGRLAGVDLERRLELLDRAKHHPLLRVDAPQVHVGEVPRLIARSRLGFLQPLNRLVELSPFDEVGPDVVVRVAEGWVDSDRLLTLLDCLADATLKAVGPTAERVCLGGGVEPERFCVELDCALKVTAEVVLLPLQPQPQCLVLENAIIHGSLRHVQPRQGSVPLMAGAAQECWLKGPRQPP